ncbi:DUF1624 domain-containing protein [Mucilaginibacter limnophilus]|uniref:DUF1624 domain-containing protein n=1 Tax=Mucilaginibacter limnophilus TaxID=1932778 RepID=A0A437MZE1_9SPHI|nr:heparan-alpha-glucosaminide N-acetyltransferase domain-containing protein [Mucilaginibacter limnophilus]RVU03050.1 DUF1624 domain-containing protein [Mucilaginibacter limnophilus]
MQQPLAQTKERFLSLDVFRGITICLMIIVNTPGSGADAYWPLQHAAWHGFTPTDLVFPSFLFAVGNAMSFTMKKYYSMPGKEVLLRVFKRTALIFLIGFLLYWFPFYNVDETGNYTFADVGHTRVMGVLQRIALCYCFASLMIYYLKTRTVVIISALLLGGYWYILLKYGSADDPLSMTGNAGLFLDRFLLGEAHLYMGEGIPFDPEGLLSTIPAIVNVIIGYYAGTFIQSKGKSNATVFRLLLTGGIMVILASGWNILLPFNKKLWTSSFALLTCGLDLLVIGMLIYIVEIKKLSRWTSFFTVFGKNPLLIYIFSELLVIILYRIPVAPRSDVYDWLNKRYYQPVAPGPLGSLLFAISAMLLCWCVAWYLNKRNIFIKI